MDRYSFTVTDLHRLPPAGLPAHRGSIPHPTHQLCTLRVRRHRRLTQHSLPGGPLGLIWAGLAPADRASFAWRLPLFDHLVGECEHCRRDGKAERLGGFEINHELELGSLHNRQVSGFFAFENATRVNSDLAIHIRQAVSVT